MREWKIPLFFLFTILHCISVCSPEQRKRRKKPQIWPVSTLPVKYPASAYSAELQRAKSKERGEEKRWRQ